LPLLGVAYADLYRQTKIQESLYETLTAEYEMAKVQEAKETPSVKVLDSPNVPQRRSFPPRLQIVFLAIALAIIARMVFVFAQAQWDTLHETDPRKVFAREVMDSVSVRLAAMQPNNSRLRGAMDRVRASFERTPAIDSEPVESEPTRNLQSV